MSSFPPFLRPFAFDLSLKTSFSPESIIVWSVVESQIVYFSVGTGSKLVYNNIHYLVRVVI